MMKVYIVQHAFEYEGFEIEGVYLWDREAELRVQFLSEKLPLDQTTEWYEVTEHEVIGT